jgi:hypothetical protein
MHPRISRKRRSQSSKNSCRRQQWKVTNMLGSALQMKILLESQFGDRSRLEKAFYIRVFSLSESSGVMEVDMGARPQDDNSDRSKNYPKYNTL